MLRVGENSFHSRFVNKELKQKRVDMVEVADVRADQGGDFLRVPGAYGLDQRFVVMNLDQALCHVGIFADLYQMNLLIERRLLFQQMYVSGYP